MSDATLATIAENLGVDFPDDDAKKDALFDALNELIMTTPLDPAAVAAVESDLEDFDRLKDLILTLLPYALDDGEDPPTEANAEECVEYAADEIKRLRAEVAALRAALVRMVDAVEKEGNPRQRNLVDAFMHALKVLDKKKVPNA